MKRFWNWIRNEAGGRVLRLEGPIDEESFWGDEVNAEGIPGGAGGGLRRHHGLDQQSGRKRVCLLPRSTQC